MKAFHPAVREWFASSFPSPTKAQQAGWPAIARGESTLILAPTGSGKTTTLYSALKAVAGPDVNVTTIEDPI